MDSKINEFNRLCESCGLSGWGYTALLSLLIDRLEGRFLTEEEISSDFSALEIATLLRQLNRAKTLSITVNRVNEKYGENMILVLTNALTDALNAHIQKRENITQEYRGNKTNLGANMILNKGYGGGGTGRAFLIPYPNGELPQEDGFSKAELDAIINYERAQLEVYKASQGNGTRSRELGHLAEWIIDSFLPSDWVTDTKYFFVINYLIIAGYLDFEGQEWFDKHNKMSINEQSRKVRYWIDAYHKANELEQD